MIGYLRGRLGDKQPNRVVIDVHGVGYELHVPLSTFYGLGETGAEVALRVHTHVREDTLALFGFATTLELQLFEHLIAVNGVGPRLALTVLSGMEPPDFIRAVRQGDVARLTRIPGVGRKTAERIGLELKDRLAAAGVHEADVDEPDAGRTTAIARTCCRRCSTSGTIVQRPSARSIPPARRERPASRGRCGARCASLRAERGPRLGIVTTERVVSAAPVVEEEQYEVGLRPRTLADYVGQERVRENLTVSIAAARKRGEALDHVLLYGPPGLGKTTLAYVVAGELGVQVRATSGPVLEKPGDLAALLTNLAQHDVLFIDEIHRMSPVVEEILYPAMEDYELDIMIGQGPSARSVKVPLQRFTLVGATTRAGLLTSPLRARFGIVHRLDFYMQDELREIVTRSARILGVPIDEPAARELARRARGTPRVANRLLRRVRDYAEVRADGAIDVDVARRALELLEVDDNGFDEADRRLLEAIIDKFGGGPVGLSSIAAAISEEKEAIEDIYEPFLIQTGFIDRTPRGRVATERAYNYFGRPGPERSARLW